MNNEKIKGAIFDMDGVILDTEKLYLRFWKQAAADFGYKMTDGDVFGIRSLARKFAVEKLKGIFGRDFPYYDIHARRVELMDAFIKENGFEMKRGVFELLDFLRENGIKTAVATATARQKTMDYLESIGAAKYFDAVICGDMVENGKPAPDIYIKAASELQLPPEQCAAFEDSPNGIKSAYSAGCKTIMIPDLTQPDGEVAPLLSGVYESLDKAVEFFNGRC
jgi:HAD hydrolase, family IA, variant 3